MAGTRRASATLASDLPRQDLGTCRGDGAKVEALSPGSGIPWRPSRGTQKCRNLNLLEQHSNRLAPEGGGRIVRVFCWLA